MAQVIYERAFCKLDGFVPWVHGGNSLMQTEARVIASAALKAGGVVEALAAVLVRDAAFRGDCGCIGLSRDAEREYETGQCPHQKGRDLLGLSLADCRAAFTQGEQS